MDPTSAASSTALDVWVLSNTNPNNVQWEEVGKVLLLHTCVHLKAVRSITNTKIIKEEW